MINLDTVKPGDILRYRGQKCTVKGVTLQRNADLTTEVTGISVKMEDYSQPHICPSGFKDLVAYSEEPVQVTTKFVVIEITQPVMERLFKVGKLYECSGNTVNTVSGEPVLRTFGTRGFSHVKNALFENGVIVIEVTE